MRVEDAQGAAPNIPFWLGEALGRSDELSLGVSRLRSDVAARLAAHGAHGAIDALVRDVGLSDEAARQIVDYLQRAQAALGALPTQQQIVLERFLR